MQAVARLDWGRWVADCPNPMCSSAMHLERGQRDFHCRFKLDDRGNYGGCGTLAPIAWPGDPAGIEAGVADLPESRQQWRPPVDEDEESA
jgi:hypothetical protein